MGKTIKTFWTDFQVYEHIAELKHKEIIKIKNSYYRIYIDYNNKDHSKLKAINLLSLI